MGKNNKTKKLLKWKAINLTIATFTEKNQPKSGNTSKFKCFYDENQYGWRLLVYADKVYRRSCSWEKKSHKTYFHRCHRSHSKCGQLFFFRFFPSSLIERSSRVLWKFFSWSLKIRLNGLSVEKFWKTKLTY